MIFDFYAHILFKIDKSIAETIVGSTRFFLETIKIITHIKTTTILIVSSDSASTPAGNIIILPNNAAKV